MAKPTIPNNIKIVIGVILMVLGLVGAIPSFLVSKYGIATVASILVIMGIVFFALGFEE